MFHDHEDLLREFVHFLPGCPGSGSVNNPLFGRNTVPHDRNSPFPVMHPKHFEKVLLKLFFLNGSHIFHSVVNNVSDCCSWLKACIVAMHA